MAETTDTTTTTTTTTTETKVSPVVLGSTTFQDGREVMAYISDITRVKYKLGEKLSGEDFEVAYSLLSHHPRFHEKVGEIGVDAIAVGRHPTFKRKCLMIVKKNGDIEDFSALKCVDSIFGRDDSFSMNKILKKNVVIRFDLSITKGAKKGKESEGAKKETENEQAKKENENEEAKKETPESNIIAELMEGDEERERKKVPIEVMKDIRAKVKEIFTKAAGDEHFIESIELWNMRNVQFAQLSSEEIARSTVAALTDVAVFPPAGFEDIKLEKGWHCTISNFAIATGDEEKIFWERITVLRDKQKNKSAENAAAAAAANSGSGKIVVQYPRAVSPTPTNTISVVGHQPSKADILKKQVTKGPRVTPTDGQTKRPATQVGVSRGPPPRIVPKKQAKLSNDTK